MGKTYKIIMIDDKHEQLKSVRDRALMKGIEIEAFSTSYEGIKALEDNINYWDGIILDAMCWNETEHETPTLKGMRNSIDKILELRKKHNISIPCFIYSAQGGLLADENFKDMVSGIGMYSKTLRKDTERLFDDIKKEADTRLETQLKYKYKDVLFCKEELNNKLFKILYELEYGSFTEPEPLNEMRKILERLIEKLNKNTIVNNKKMRLTAFSRMLEKVPLKDFVPIWVQRSFHSASNILNDGSHDEEDTIVDKAITEGKAPYLLRSVAYDLLNIMHWANGLLNNAELLQEFREKIIEAVKDIENEKQNKKNY